MEPLVIYAAGAACAFVLGAVVGAQMAYRSCGYGNETAFYFVGAYVRDVIRNRCF